MCIFFFIRFMVESESWLVGVYTVRAYVYVYCMCIWGDAVSTTVI